MKKHIYSFIALLFAAQMAWAKVTPSADIPAYWASVDGKAGGTLLTDLSLATAVGYHSLGYGGLWAAYVKTDVYPSDSVGRAGEIWDTYSACHFSTSDHGSYSRECDKFNREHTVPQSWWGSGTTNQGCDIFQVLPTDGYVNNWRGNDPYGEVSSAQKTSTNGCKSGPSARSGYSGIVFEPADQYKGDLARGILGAMVKWRGNWTQAQGNSTFTGTYTEAGHYGLTQYAVDLFMKWHREDPVSRKEVDRNNGIQDTQGNRNPFIDYPYLAEYLWGEHVGEAVDMSKLMPSTDPEFILGKSNGWRTDTVPPTPPTPPTPAVKYGVTWSANGEELQTDSVEENKAIALLPQEPLSCSIESNVFAGWTDSPIEDSTDVVPEHLYLSLPDFPLVTEDVTYYAVFAKADTTGSATPDTYVFDADSQDGWTCTASKTNDYWLLTDHKTIVSPSVDLARLESIVVKMRTYGGATFDELDIYELDGKLTTMEATAGSTMTEYTWMNNLYIAGISTLTFSTDYTSNKGIGIQSIVINAAGSSVSYSRYITNCQETSELEWVTIEAPIRKILVGGHLFILRDGNIYNVHGVRVR